MERIKSTQAVGRADFMMQFALNWHYSIEERTLWNKKWNGFGRKRPWLICTNILLFPCRDRNIASQSGWPSLDPEYDLAFQNTQRHYQLINRELRFDLGGGIKVLSVCASNPHGEVEVKLQSFLISAIGEVLSTHWIVARVDPRARLDALKEREISCPCRVSKHSSPADQSLFRLCCRSSLQIWSSLRNTKQSLEIVKLNLLVAKKWTSISWLPHKLIFLRNSRRYFKMWVGRVQPTDKHKSCSIHVALCYSSLSLGICC